MVAVPDIQPDVRARRAVSHVRSVAFDGSLSVAEVRIETGRTHQIRVHLQVGSRLKYVHRTSFDGASCCEVL